MTLSKDVHLNMCILVISLGKTPASSLNTSERTLTIRCTSKQDVLTGFIWIVYPFINATCSLKALCVLKTELQKLFSRFQLCIILDRSCVSESNQRLKKLFMI